MKQEQLTMGPTNQLATMRAIAERAGVSRTTVSYVLNGHADQRNISAEEVGKSAVYLLSDLSSGVTGETLFVDSGFNIVGL